MTDSFQSFADAFQWVLGWRVGNYIYTSILSIFPFAWVLFLKFLGYLSKETRQLKLIISMIPLILVPMVLSVLLLFNREFLLSKIDSVLPFDEIGEIVTKWELDIATNKNKGEVEGRAYYLNNEKGKKGVLVTCAGETVSLVPVTPYSEERIGKIYGDSGSAGFQKLAEWKLFKRPDSDYLAQMKRTTCDANATFKFVDVPDGKFFVLIEVVWVAWNTDRSIKEGGYRSGSLMRRIKLHEGERRIEVRPWPA